MPFSFFDLLAEPLNATPKHQFVLCIWIAAKYEARLSFCRRRFLFTRQLWKITSFRDYRRGSSTNVFQLCDTYDSATISAIFAVSLWFSPSEIDSTARDSALAAKTCPPSCWCSSYYTFADKSALTVVIAMLDVVTYPRPWSMICSLSVSEQADQKYKRWSLRVQARLLITDSQVAHSATHNQLAFCCKKQFGDNFVNELRLVRIRWRHTANSSKVRS